MDSKHFTNLNTLYKMERDRHTYLGRWRLTKDTLFMPVTQHIIQQLQTSFHPRTQISLLPLLKGKWFLARLQLLLPLFNERAETSLLADRNCD
jgi:hypothetical protein